MKIKPFETPTQIIDYITPEEEATIAETAKNIARELQIAEIWNGISTLLGIAILIAKIAIIIIVVKAALIIIKSEKEK